MKQKFLWGSLCLSFLIVFNAFAGNSLFQIKNKEFNEIRIPLFWDEKIKIPLVEVKVGDQTLRMGLDTGADQATLAIKPDLIKRLKANFLAGKKRSMDVSGNRYEARSFILPSVSIGDLRLDNMTAAEELRTDEWASDGIIGNKVLQDFHVLIDYQASEMVLYPNTMVPRFLNTDGWIKTPFAHEKIGIVVQGKLPGIAKKLRFCLDTGLFCGIQGKSMGMIRSEWAKEAERKELGANQYLTTDPYSIGTMDFGPMDFWVNDFKQPPVDGFLGHNLLKDYKLFIDFAHCNLYFKRN